MVDYPTVVADLRSLPARFHFDLEPDLGSPPLVQHTSMILTGSAFAAGSVSGSFPLAEPEGIHVTPGTPGPMSSWRFALTNARTATGDRERLLWVWADRTIPPHHCPTCPKIEEEHLGRLEAFRTGGGIRQTATTH